MGLGAATVVRLEGALAHEVLRYCTAMRRSALKVVRGKNGAGPLFDESERVDGSAAIGGPRPRTTLSGLHG
jgi:hypothetical protein